MVLQYVPVWLYIVCAGDQCDNGHVPTAKTGIRRDIGTANGLQTPTPKGINIQQDQPKGSPEGSSPSFEARAFLAFLAVGGQESVFHALKDLPECPMMAILEVLGENLAMI